MKKRGKKAPRARSAPDPLFPTYEEQKRGYDRWRRRRLRDYHRLYKPLDRADPEVCYYCGKRATTLDHCPSLAGVDLMGLKFFTRMRIPLVLIPACRDCNQGTHHVFRCGRVVQMDYRRVLRVRRAPHLRKLGIYRR